MKAVVGNGFVSSDYKSCVNANLRLVAPSQRPTFVAHGYEGRLAVVNTEWLQFINSNYNVGALVGGVAWSVFMGIGWKAL